VTYWIAAVLAYLMAIEVWQDIARLPIRLADVTLDRVSAAAYVKTHHAIS